MKPPSLSTAARSRSVRFTELSPMALRFLKAAMNADCDGQIGLLDFGGDATLLYYLSEEAQEGRNAYVEKRQPDFKKFPRFP